MHFATTLSVALCLCAAETEPLVPVPDPAAPLPVESAAARDAARMRRSPGPERGTILLLHKGAARTRRRTPSPRSGWPSTWAARRWNSTSAAPATARRAHARRTDGASAGRFGAVEDCYYEELLLAGPRDAGTVPAADRPRRVPPRKSRPDERRCTRAPLARSGRTGAVDPRRPGWTTRFWRTAAGRHARSRRRLQPDNAGAVRTAAVPASRSKARCSAIGPRCGRPRSSRSWSSRPGPVRR